MEGNSHALQWILDSNPVVGMDLGPDVANHAKKLGQDAFSVSLLRALHALHLASCSLFHLSRQVPLGAHGLVGVGKGIEERKAKAETEKEGSRQVEKIRLLLALKFLLPLSTVLLHLHLCLLLCLLQTPGLPLSGICHLLSRPLLGLQELLDTLGLTGHFCRYG